MRSALIFAAAATLQTQTASGICLKLSRMQVQHKGIIGKLKSNLDRLEKIYCKDSIFYVTSPTIASLFHFGVVAGFMIALVFAGIGLCSPCDDSNACTEYWIALAFACCAFILWIYYSFYDDSDMGNLVPLIVVILLVVSVAISITVCCFLDDDYEAVDNTVGVVGLTVVCAVVVIGFHKFIEAYTR